MPLNFRREAHIRESREVCISKENECSKVLCALIVLQLKTGGTMYATDKESKDP